METGFDLISDLSEKIPSSDECSDRLKEFFQYYHFQAILLAQEFQPSMAQVLYLQKKIRVETTLSFMS